MLKFSVSQSIGQLTIHPYNQSIKYSMIEVFFHLNIQLVNRLINWPLSHPINQWGNRSINQSFLSLAAIATAIPNGHILSDSGMPPRSLYSRPAMPYSTAGYQNSPRININADMMQPGPGKQAYWQFWFCWQKIFGTYWKNMVLYIV